MHSCTHTLCVGWKQQKQLVCQAVWTHLSSICRLLLTDTRKETREVATVCHALILSTLVNKFFILRQKQNIDALSNNLTQINLDKHIYSTMSPLHLFYSLPHFLPPTVDACLEQIRGSELPYDSSCNGYRFVRWPDSAAPPLGHRCHSHGTEEQMFVKGEKRGRRWGEDGGVWPTPHGTDTKHLSAHANMLLGSDTYTGMHPGSYTPAGKVLHHMSQLILKHKLKRDSKKSLPPPPSPSSVWPNFFEACSPLSSCFYLWFVCGFSPRCKAL